MIVSHDNSAGGAGAAGGLSGPALFLNVFLVLLVMVIWGFSYVIIRVTVKDGIIPPFTLAFLRFCVGLAALHAAPLGREARAAEKPGRRDSARIVLMGFFGVFLYFALENWGLVYTTATNASILISLAPVFTMIGAIILFRQRASAANWLGMAVAFAGSAFVVWNGKVNFELNPLGDIFIVLSAGAWAGYTLVGRDIVNRYDSIIVSRRIILTGMLMFAPFAAYEYFAGGWSGITVESLFGVGYLGVLCTALAFILWNRMMAALGIVFVTNMIYLQCAITMACAWVTIREPVTGMLLCGTAAVIAGVYLANLNLPRSRAPRVK